jgi:serine/threonine protein kinase
MNHYETLGLTKTASADEIKRAFRELAQQHHPDHNGSAERFKVINEAHRVLSDPVTRARYDKTGSDAPVVLRSRKGTYELTELIACGAVADVYRAGDFVVKVARHHQNNDLLVNEATMLRALDRLNVGGDRYRATLVDTFVVDSGTRRQASVFEYVDGFYPLTAIRTAWSNHTKWEHLVWMFNRILEGLAEIHRAGFVHGAVLPPHLLVYAGPTPNPWAHGVKLIGWGASTRIGAPLRVTAEKAWEGRYPPEVWDKRPATPGLDIFMAARSMLAFNCGPGYLSRFFATCVWGNVAWRPQCAWSLRQELAQLMSKNYGPKQYHPFHMPQL